MAMPERMGRNWGQTQNSRAGREWGPITFGKSSGGAKKTIMCCRYTPSKTQERTDASSTQKKVEGEGEKDSQHNKREEKGDILKSESNSA